MSSVETRRRLARLKVRLDEVNHAWTAEDYKAQLAFYVEILPRLLEAERCTIFIHEPGSETLWSMMGTGLREHEIEAPLEDSIVGRAITAGRFLIENQLERREGFHAVVAKRKGFVIRHILCAPIQRLTDYGFSGAIQLVNKNADEGFTEEDGQLLERITRYVSMALENVLLHREIIEITGRLDRELEELAGGAMVGSPFIAESRPMRAVLELAATVSQTPVNVFIQGENGTGKELVANFIHHHSPRREHPFVAVNCSAIPENLIESEFFGYEKGAFTGATASRKGRFEEAEGGTLFLDEIAEMPFHIQPKFLRALQEREGVRLGSNQVRRYDFRIVSATNKDLREEVRQGRFREDLYYRLFSVELKVPPLRERREDIIALAMAFLDDVQRKFGKRTLGYSQEVMALFESYPWPGNVRQLRHEVERLVALTPEGGQILPNYCSPELRGGAIEGSAPAHRAFSLNLSSELSSLELKLITEALQQTGGTKTKAAKLLGITRQGLDKKMERYGLRSGKVVMAAGELVEP